MKGKYPEVPLLNPEIGLTVDELVSIYNNPTDDHAHGLVNVANFIWGKSHPAPTDLLLTGWRLEDGLHGGRSYYALKPEEVASLQSGQKPEEK